MRSGLVESRDHDRHRPREMRHVDRVQERLLQVRDPDRCLIGIASRKAEELAPGNAHEPHGLRSQPHGALADRHRAQHGAGLLLDQPVMPQARVPREVVAVVQAPEHKLGHRLEIIEAGARTEQAGAIDEIPSRLQAVCLTVGHHPPQQAFHIRRLLSASARKPCQPWPIQREIEGAAHPVGIALMLGVEVVVEKMSRCRRSSHNAGYVTRSVAHSCYVSSETGPDAPLALGSEVGASSTGVSVSPNARSANAAPPAGSGA